MSEHLDEHQDDEAEQGLDVADFDAFFAEQAKKSKRQPITLFGRKYVLPESLPLLFTLQAERVQHSSDPDDVRRMLTILFGTDVLDKWAEKGLTDKQLGIVLIYSAAAVRAPGTISVERAAELYDEQEQGKAPGPNRAARRAKGKKGKARTSGARS
ncbi:hypothetical protein ACFUGD_06680 [Streptomyces sp. NPDC057217]|uniref:hypothetical protein n=1 Tax=Streptomyces sp. NPDC057217 TaxID=3346054 RepID=UPI0036314F32